MFQSVPNQKTQASINALRTEMHETFASIRSEIVEIYDYKREAVGELNSCIRAIDAILDPEDFAGTNELLSIHYTLTKLRDKMQTWAVTGGTNDDENGST